MTAKSIVRQKWLHTYYLRYTHTNDDDNDDTDNDTLIFYSIDYAKWGQLLPLCWVKMLWRLLQHFDIHLHMGFNKIPFPRERDQVIMEIFFAADLSLEAIGSLG